MDVSQKETIVFQPSIFRGELLVSHGEAQAVGDEEAMKRYGARLVFRGTRGKKLRAGKWWFKLDPQKISNTFFFGGGREVGLWENLQTNAHDIYHYSLYILRSVHILNPSKN